MSNKQTETDSEKTQEFFTSPEDDVKSDTKIFDSADDSASVESDKTSEEDSASAYNLAGGEDVVYEFKRKSSGEYAAALRRMKWHSLDNARFIIYIAFFVVLLVFAVYYTVKSDYLVAIFAFAAALFMLYLVFFGHNVLLKGMESDESPESVDVLCKMCSKNIYLLDNGRLEILPYSAVKKIKYNKKYICLLFKKSPIFGNGLILSAEDKNPAEIKEFIKSKAQPENKIKAQPEK